MIHSFFSYLDQSPTPFHAVKETTAILAKAGFSEIKENETWKLVEGSKYYITRGGSLAAFVWKRDKPFHITSAHTDSPGLKLKPNPEFTEAGSQMLGIEVYGGPLLYTWFDRDLSIAGKVEYVSEGKQKSQLIDFVDSIAIIPSLAIHLNREANKGWKIDPQTELAAILNLSANKEETFKGTLLKKIQEQDPAATKILDSDLFLYPTEKAAFIGADQSLIASSRIDNLFSCFAGLEAITTSEGPHCNILVLNDHEEVGSQSYSGAGGPFLVSLLRRLTSDLETEAKLLADSLMLSVDGAHGLHPNYKSKHDPNHGPKIGGGPVLKSNANQRYASQAGANGKVMLLAEKAGVKIQRFVVKAGQGCGSTIGPISSAQTGIETVDLGASMFAMHSIRETCGAADLKTLVLLLKELYQN